MAGGVYVRPDAGRVVLGNDRIERVIEVADGRLRTVAVLGKHGGARLALDSDEFRLALADGRVLTTDACRVVNWEHETTPAGGRRVTVHLTSQPERLDARAVYELEPDDFHVRKRLLFRSLDGDVQVDSLDVEHFTCPAEARLGGRGQPIYLDDTFFVGLEYPAGFNESADGRITLRHYPSWIRAQADLVSKTAVLGVAPVGEVADAFAWYIDRIRRTAPGFVTLNSGGEVQIYEPTATPDLTERVEDCLLRCADLVKEHLYDKGGPVLRSFVLDAGWQDPMTLYEVDRRKFPNGFGPLLERLGRMESNLGLWLSLSTPLSERQLDRGFMDSAGYGVAQPDDRHPCISEPRYNQALRKILKKHIEEHGVCHFKFDFNHFACTSADHGHLGDEKHGFETNLDAQIDLLHYVASLREDVTIGPTCGMWLSPWWLMHADMIWPHGMWDFNYSRKPVALHPRDWAATYRDQNLYHLFRTEQCQFPISGVTGCGCMCGPRYNIAGPLESTRRFADMLVHAYGRQLRLRRKDMSSPLNMTEQKWDIMRGALRWALDREPGAAPGRMILGVPDEGQLYGYSYLGPDGGVVTLRNPSHDVQTQPITLDALAPGRDYRVEITYPYRRVLAPDARGDASVPVSVGPYGVVAVEVTPASELVRPVLRGVGYGLVAERPGELVCDVWTRPGEPAELALAWPGGIGAVEIDGTPVPIERCPAVTVSLPSTGQPEAARVKPLPRMKDKQGFWRRSVRVDVPDTWEAGVVLVARESVVRSPVFAVNMGGWFGGLPFHVVVGEGWVAYQVTLDPRDMNAVTWRLTDDDDSQAPDTELWLAVEGTLAPRRVRITYEPGAATPRRPELPTPFAGHHARWIPLYPLEGEPSAGDGVEWVQEFIDEYK